MNFNVQREVALMVSWSGGKDEIVKTPLSTMQVAPTILQALGIDWHELLAVAQEGIALLPVPRCQPTNRKPARGGLRRPKERARAACAGDSATRARWRSACLPAAPRQDCRPLQGRRVRRAAWGW